MKKISYILLFNLFVIYSCSDKLENVPQEYLRENALTTASSLQVDTVLSGDTFPTANRFYYYNDSVIIVFNRGQENDFFLKFYNSNRKEVVKAAFMFGNGPKEMLLPAIETGGDDLLIRDVQGEKLCILNVDSFLNSNRYSMSMIKNQYFRISNLCKFNDDIVAVNPFTFVDKQNKIEQDCGSKIVRLGDLEELYNQSHLYNTINVASEGEILVNSKLQKMIFACGGQSFIEIYDRKLNVIKRINGPIGLDVKYYISDDKEVVYKKKIPYTYLASCKNDKYFYLYFMGDYWYIDTKSMDNHKGYIIKFDWNGNYVKSYQVDRYVYALSCNKKYQGGDELYVTVNDDNGIPMLLKLYE